MSENWNEILENESIDLGPRPGFEAELRAGLSDQWKGRPPLAGTAVSEHADRRTRGGWLLGAAAAAVLLIGGMVVATRPGDDSTVQTPTNDTVPLPTASPTVPTTDAVVDPTPETTPDRSATTAVETMTTPSATAPPGNASRITVPLNPTNPLMVKGIATVEYGSGDEQIEVLNGEFPPPAVWYNGSVLVLEDAPSSGLTGDGVIAQTGPDSKFDDGTAQRISAVTIDVAEPGGTPLAVRSLDGGEVVVVTAHDEQPRIRIRQYTQNPPGQLTQFGDGADRETIDDSQLRITSDGATWGGDVVIPPNASNPVAARPIVTIDPAMSGSSVYEIERPAQDDQPATRWALDIEIDQEFPPAPGGPLVEPFGDGALVVVSNSSARSSEPALVVLDSDGDGAVYDLDGWSVADVRPQGALLTRSTANGLELANLPPDTIDTPDAVDAPDGSSVESPTNLFVTTPGDREPVIDVRDAVDVVSSFDLACAPERECAVRSATIVGDTIWVAITETASGDTDTIVRSRVVSVSRLTGEIAEHLSLDGSAVVQSAGRGADGVLYAHVVDRGGADRTLVGVEAGQATVLETKVAGFRLSDDGRFLAVSFSDPPTGETARFEISDLVDQSANGFDTPYVNAGPGAWSPNGRFLIVNEQWEDGTAWVIDPWSAAGDLVFGDPLTGATPMLDGSCFMSDDVIAHRTWNVGYGRGDAQPGVVRVTSLDTGTTITELGNDLFGDAFRCHTDGSISYVRRPVIEVESSPGYFQPEPDIDAPTELVHIATDGTTSVQALGDQRMV